MIQKISNPGKGFRGVLNYTLADKKHPELIAGNMGGQNPRTLAKEFGDWRALNERVGKPVFHSSLSAAPTDEITADLWSTLAQAYLDRLGYGDCPWVAIRHRDADHDHVHIIASRVDDQGNRIDDAFERTRGEDILRDLEREFGLQRIAPSREAPRSAPTRGQLAGFEETGQLPVAPRLQEHLDLAARGHPTMTLFVERLEAAGVQVRPNIASTGRVSGISFAFYGVAFKGSDLGRAYSWKGLQDRRGVTYEPDRDLPTLRSAAARAAAPARQSAGSADSPGTTAPMPPLDQPVEAYRAGAVLASRVELLERHDHLAHLHRETADRIDIAERLLQDRDRLLHELALLERAFEHEIGQAFAQPHSAREQVNDHAGRRGYERAAQHLGQHPEEFGSLRGLGLATLKNSSRRAALAAAKCAARQLSSIGRLRARLSAVEQKRTAAAPVLGPAQERAASNARARRLLPRPASLRHDIARSAKLIGNGVVSAISFAHAYWVARALHYVAHTYRDLLDRDHAREDDGLSR